MMAAQNAFNFDGDTYDPLRDFQRLALQMQGVISVLRSGKWVTLCQLAKECAEWTGKATSEAGVSARLRDLRKPLFGGQEIERENLGGGLWRYRWVR